jgi:hypothetical protein
MTRNERMPFSQIAAMLNESPGFWAFVGGVIATTGWVVVGLFTTRSKRIIAIETSLKEREDSLADHYSNELTRLNVVVADLDNALKAQAIHYREEMRREREECNAKMAALKAELEILKRRMTSEEQR